MAKNNNIIKYGRNVIRSIGYTAIDVFSDMNPALKSFAESNEELGKELYASIKDYKSTIKRAKKAIVESDIVEFAVAYKKNFIEDIRSGNFYNKEREDKINNSMFGGLDDIGGDNDDWGDINLDKGWGDDDDSWDIDDGDEYLADSMDTVGEKIANATAMATERSAEYIVEGQRQSTKILFQQQTHLFDRLNFSIAALNSNMANITALAEPLNTHMQNSQQFYTNITTLITEQRDLMKQVVENTTTNDIIQKKKEKELKDYDYIMSSGIPDIKRYFEAVTKNIDNQLSGIKSLNSMFGEGTSILQTFAASPIKSILEVAMKKFIPDMMKSAFDSLNQTLEGFFGSVLMKINSTKHTDGPMSWIGKIFGIEDRYKTSIDTSRYEKGKVPFDGITRKAIIEVIPTQLAKIISLLSGQSESRFNYETGKFQSVDSIKEQNENQKKSAALNASADIRKEINEYLKSIDFRNFDQKKRINDEITQFFVTLFNNAEMFDYNNIDKYAYDYGLSNETYNMLKASFIANKQLGKGYLNLQLNDRIMAGRNSTTRSMKLAEEKGDTILTALNNNSISTSKSDSDKYYNEKNTLFNKLTLSNQKDKKGNNIFFYLQYYYTVLGSIAAGLGIGGTRAGYSNNNLVFGTDVPDNSRTEDLTWKERKIKDNHRANEQYELKREARRKTAEKEGRDYANFDDLVGETDKETQTNILSVIQTKERADKFKEQMKREEESKSNKLFDKIRKMNANERFNKIVDSVQGATREPVKYFSGIVGTVNNMMYEFIYGKPGKQVGFMQQMMDGIQNTFIKFNNWLDEKILNPLAEKYDIHNFADIIYKGFEKIGIDMRGLVGDVKDYLLGPKGENGREGGLLREIADSIKENAKSVWDWIKNGFAGIFGPIFENIKNGWTNFKDNHFKPKAKKEKNRNETDTNIEEPTTNVSAVDTRTTIEKLQDAVANNADNSTIVRLFNEARSDMIKNIPSTMNIEDVVAAHVRDNTGRSPRFAQSANGPLTLNELLLGRHINMNERDKYYSDEEIAKRVRSNDFQDYLKELNNALFPTEQQEKDREYRDKVMLNIDYIKNNWSTLFPNMQMPNSKADMKKIIGRNINYIRENEKLFMPQETGLAIISNHVDKMKEDAKATADTNNINKFNSLMPNIGEILKANTKHNEILNNIGKVLEQSNNYLKNIMNSIQNINNTRYNNRNNIFDIDSGIFSSDNTSENNHNNTDQYFKGGEVKKTGLAAVSEGELIIPSEYNPFYNGITDKVKQDKEEKKAINKFFGQFANGGTVGQDDNTNYIFDNTRKRAGLVDTTGSARIADIVYNKTKDIDIDAAIAMYRLLHGDSDSDKSVIPINRGTKIYNALNKKLGRKVTQSDLEVNGENWSEIANIIADKFIEIYAPNIAYEIQNKLNTGALQENIDNKINELLDDEQTILGNNSLKEQKEGLGNKFRNKYIEDESLIDKTINTVSYSLNRLFGDPNKIKEEDDKVKAITNDIFENAGVYAGPAATGALIGGGVSLLTGMVGGPLLGAAVGAATALTMKSDVLNRTLFGAETENGTMKGGVLGDKLSTFIKKKLPTMLQHGIAGGIISLLPFIPGGPVTGIIVGSAIGYAKQTEDTRNFLFGEEGIFGKDTDKKLKKKLPAMGIGAAAGAFMGPFGFLGNLVLGAGLGLVSDSEDFKNFIFGRENDKGERVGGMLGAIRDNIIDPLKDWSKKTLTNTADYLKDHILKPLGDALKPLSRQLYLTIESVFRGTAEKFHDWLKTTLGMPIAQSIGRMFKPITKLLTGTISTVLKPARFIASLPFRALGEVGNHFKKKQIKNGTANYMTAEERLDFRKKHNMGRNDKTKDFDKTLASMNNEDIVETSSLLDRISRRVSFGDEAHEISANVANTLTNEIGYKKAKQIMKEFNNGNFIDSRTMLSKSKLSDERKTELYRYIDEQGAKRNELLDAEQSGDTVTKQAAKKLRKLGFKNIDEDSLKGRQLEHLQDLINKEIRSGKGTEENKTKVFVDQGQKQLDILERLADTLDSIRAHTDPESEFAKRYNAKLKQEEGKPRVKYETDERGNVHRYVINKEGEFEEDKTDSQTKEANEELQENDQRLEDIRENTGGLKGFGEKISGIFHKFFPTKEEKEDDDGVFSRIKSIGRGLLKFGLIASVGGAAHKYYTFNLKPIIQEWWNDDFKPYLTSELPDKIKNVWLPKLADTTIGKAILSIPEKIGEIIHTVGEGFNWLTNVAGPWVLGSGQYKENGLVPIIGKAIGWAIPTLLEGFCWTMEYMGPQIVRAIVSTIPKLLWATVKAIGTILTSALFKKDKIDLSKEDFSKVTVTDTSNKPTFSGSKFSDLMKGGSNQSISSVANQLLGSITGNSRATSMNETISATRTAISENGIEDKAAIQSQLYQNGIPKMTAASIAHASNTQEELEANINRYYNKTFGIDSSMTTEEQEEKIQDAYKNGYTEYNNMATTVDNPTAIEYLGEAAFRGLTKGNHKIAKGTGKLIGGLATASSKLITIPSMIKNGGKLGKVGKLADISAKGINTALDVATDSKSIAQKIAKKLGKGGSTEKLQTAASRWAKAAEKGLFEGSEGAAKLTSSITKATAEDTSLVAKAVNLIGNGIKKLMGSVHVQKIIKKITGKNADDVVKIAAKAADALTNGLAGALKKASKGLNSVLNVLNSTVFSVVSMIYDFIKGYDQAESILGITSPTILEMFIAGIINVITEKFTLGLIPASTVVDIVLDKILPLFNIDNTKIQQKRANVEQELYEWNAAHPDAQYDSIDDFLRKDDISTKIRSATSDIWNGIKSVFGKDSGSYESRYLVDENKISKVNKSARTATLAANGSGIGINMYRSPISRLYGGTSDINNIKDEISNNALDYAVGQVTDVVKKDFTSNNFDLIKKIIDAIGKILNKVLTNNLVTSILSKITRNGNIGNLITLTINKITDKLKDVLESNIVHTARNIYSDIFSQLNKKIFSVIGYVYTFINGCDRAESILGIENPTTFETFLSGLIALLSDICFGLVEPNTLIDIVVDYVAPIFGDKLFADTKKKRKEAEEAFKRWNQTHPNEQYEDIESYLSRNDIGTKISKATSNVWDGIKSSFLSHDMGSGSFVSQYDPRYASKKFSGSNIAAEGCGPAVATMAINSIKGHNIDLSQAAQYATNRGYTGNGTSIDYFGDIFAKQGISSRYTQGKSDIEQQLKSGHTTVLLGQDKSNRSKANSPFGPGSHYVLAKGMTKDGNIIVDDPESSTPNRIYSKSILNNVKAGVATGSGSMLQEAIAQISHYEGSYDSVNRNDNGALSIGKVQWHGSRAQNLLKSIEQAQPGILEQYLGSSLANEIMNQSTSYWDKRTLTNSEKSQFITLLGTSASKQVQNQTTSKDVAGYFTYAQSKGITDPGALAEIADVTNTGYVVGNRIADKAIALAGNASSVTVDHVYEAIKNDSVAGKQIYAERYANMYQKMKNMTSFEYDPLMDKQMNVDTTDNTTANGQATVTEESSTSNTLLGLFGKLASQIMSTLFGAKPIKAISEFLGISLPDSSITSSDGFLSGSAISNNIYNGNINYNLPFGQAVAEKAASYIDKVDYVYGARDIDNKMQADCSGFTQQIYKKFGYEDMQPTVTTQDKDSRFTYIKNKADLMPGDLVMFENNDNPSDGCDHIGIYYGNNKFVHAPRTGRMVSMDDLTNTYYSQHFDHAKRVPAPASWLAQNAVVDTISNSPSVISNRFTDFNAIKADAYEMGNIQNIKETANNSKYYNGINPSFVTDSNSLPETHGKMPSMTFDDLPSMQNTRDPLNMLDGSGSNIIDPLAKQYENISEQPTTIDKRPSLDIQTLTSILDMIVTKLSEISKNTFTLDKVVQLLQVIASLKSSGSGTSDDVTKDLINQNTYVVNTGKQEEQVDSNSSDIERLTQLIGQLII